MINERFHFLLVVEEIAPAQYKSTSMRRYKCLCDCGKEVIALRANLMRGATKSCGCWKKMTAGFGRISHGKSRSDEYKIWVGMKRRCHSKSSASYAEYGALGVSVCDRWRYSFESFLSDMGKRPSKLYSIDRIDGALGYSPDNCKWSTDYEQTINRRCTTYIEVSGVKTPLIEFCRANGFSYSKLYTKIIRRKKPLELAIAELIASQ